AVRVIVCPYTVVSHFADRIVLEYYASAVFAEGLSLIVSGFEKGCHVPYEKLPARHFAASAAKVVFLSHRQLVFRTNADISLVSGYDNGFFSRHSIKRRP